MEVAGPWTEVFEGSERKEKSGGAGTLLGSSTLTLAPLVADGPSIHRSQPILITSNRYDQQQHAQEHRRHYSLWEMTSCSIGSTHTLTEQTWVSGSRGYWLKSVTQPQAISHLMFKEVSINQILPVLKIQVIKVWLQSELGVCSAVTVTG